MALIHDIFSTLSTCTLYWVHWDFNNKKRPKCIDSSQKIKVQKCQLFYYQCQPLKYWQMDFSKMAMAVSWLALTMKLGIMKNKRKSYKNYRGTLSYRLDRANASLPLSAYCTNCIGLQNEIGRNIEL